MPPEIVAYITKYGYITFFGFVFLQEVGVPTPVPNELMLLFGGYLASIGKLNLAAVFLTVVVADFIGTSVLYGVFYNFGTVILHRHLKFISPELVEKMQKRISTKGRWGIFLGRLLPYLRGYVSVAAGLLNIPPRVFIPTVALSAVLWSGGYVILGRILGDQWTVVGDTVGRSSAFMALTVVFLLLIIFGPRLYRWIKEKK